MSKAKTKTNRRMLRVELEAALIAKAEEAAAREERTLTAVVQRALREYLEKAA